MAIQGMGERLAAVRNMSKLSQEDMCRRLGISRSAFQNYERGHRDLSSELLLKIYEEFDVDPHGCSKAMLARADDTMK